MDKALEQRIRDAINDAQSYDEYVSIRMVDAKRLLYRLKKENALGNELVYVKDTRHART